MVKKRVNFARSNKLNSLKKTKTTKSSNELPGLVKAISILFYVGAFLGIVFGSFILLGSTFGSTYLKNMGLDELVNSYPDLTQTDLIIAEILLKFLRISSIVVILIGILDFFIGKGLWKRQPWARVVAIILMSLGFLISLASLDILGVIITGLIGSYLIFSKEVKRAFN